MRIHIVTVVLGVALLALGLTLTGARPAGAVLTLTISGTVTDSTTVLALDNACITLGPPIRCWTSTNVAGRHLID